ncbi:phosphoribosylglycinamide formyltransferase [Flavihumibacter profundi]|uniref:phosphoribosylglycinamide formyltransferase n=1 Tax=Flavihumibacter profundi TaxID=2716883 RepID=UPI001CC4C8CB|nr:phosphoribosylglycinamide formyltransferase [Flavihumibacter profundi]MBZ5858980.1 phosphoribosylglycinamide formyltransferase [Flavihumibacter profundi]
MFEKLQHKWKVGGMQLLLIIATFAIGGSLTGIAARNLLRSLPVEQPVLWTIIYIILVTLVWPIMVLLVSIPFGQFSFFRKYINRILARLKGKNGCIRVAIFASGTGSNAKKIMEYFENHPKIRISLVVSNKATAGVLEKAELHHIPTLIIEKEAFFRGDAYVPYLKKNKIDFIVLAGFLWKIPTALISAYPFRIINIHPALLPKYGGKGMYGQFVHEAVIAAKETESGISIHYVDEQYDHGGTIFQATCPVTAYDTPESLAQKIHALEHRHFAPVIEQTILSQEVKK